MHTIFAKNYDSRYDKIQLPNAIWRAEMVREDEKGITLDSDGGDKIALILEEMDFWPVVSFLTPNQARELSYKLLDLSNRQTYEN